MESNYTAFRWEEVEPLCLLRLLLRKLWLIVLAALIGAMLTSVVLTNLVSRSYSSTVTFTVAARSNNGNYYTNVSTTGEVAAIYSQLLQSELMSQAVHESLGGLNGTITAAQLGETNLINVTAHAASPKDALLMVQAIMENYGELSDYVSSLAVLTPLDTPTLSVTAERSYNVSRLCLTAAVLCAAAMAGVLVILSLSAGTIQTRQGAERHLDSRIIAAVPHEKDAARRAQLAKGIKKRSGGWRQLLGIQQGRRVRSDLKISSPAISFAFAEAIHRLSAKFEHEQAKGRKVFLFSSVSEAEGKSTLAANTALSLAEKKFRVLFIDLDLRRPVQNELLGLTVRKQAQLGTLLAEGASAKEILEAAVVEPTTGLHSLLSAQSYTDMIELISSPALPRLLALAREKFDYIIIDSPPLGYFADSELLSDLSDASVLVVRQDTVPAAEVNDAIDALSAGKAAFLGCVLNDMQYLFQPYTTSGSYEKSGRGSAAERSK